MYPYGIIASIRVNTVGPAVQGKTLGFNPAISAAGVVRNGVGDVTLHLGENTQIDSENVAPHVQVVGTAPRETALEWVADDECRVRLLDNAGAAAEGIVEVTLFRKSFQP